MSILKQISKHSTILMPACSILGFLVPSLSNALLPWLDEILFFLMFFTLLGIDQRALFKKITYLSVWRFAIFQNAAVCIILSFCAYAVGIRGELLLAIAAFGATSPLFGSGAIVNAMGFDALRAMAKTIVATLIMPCTLFFVLWLMASDDASLDIVVYGQRLLTYIICPILLSIIVKRVVPKTMLDTYYPKIAQFNILLVLAFPLGLIGGYRATFNDDPKQAALLFLIANILCIGTFALTYLAYLKADRQRAIIAATVSSGRNLLLTYTIAMPFVGSLFLPLVGAMQLPMCSLPFLAKLIINKSKKEHSNL